LANQPPPFFSLLVLRSALFFKFNHKSVRGESIGVFGADAIASALVTMPCLRILV
jgi:hypothetical protein